jgi:hypothetical protein
VTVVARSCIVSIAALGSALASLSCNSGSDSVNPGDQVGNLGNVGLELQLANGSSLDTVSYVVTGPDSFTRSTSISVRDSSRISTIVGGLPAGDGYTIAISAASDGGTTCAGSASFSVTAHATTVVVLQILCHEPPGQGGAVVDGRIDFCPVIDSLTANVAEVNVGRRIALYGAAHDSDNGPSPISYTWASNAGTVVSAGPSTATFTCTMAGSAAITLTASDGVCFDTLTINVSCSVPTFLPVKINEVESSGGMPGDWVELYNPGTANIDISGWIVRDNDDSHTYVIPAGATMAPGGYLLVEEADLGFGLGAADSVRLYDDTGIALADVYSWTAHATTTYGRCPNGTGGFVTTSNSTKGAANACGTIDAGAETDASASDGGRPDATDSGTMTEASNDASDGFSLADTSDDATTSFAPWPGADAVTTVDVANTFGTNVSGLTYQPAATNPAVLWAVQNGPSTLYRLLFDGATWTSTATNDWQSGKMLHYPDGTGSPDSEGVSKAEWESPAVYVSTERNNDVGATSRLSILRFDTDATGASLTATHEWNLTNDLPAVGANLGLEALTWVPDAFLVSRQFIDESTGQSYDPSLYPNHGAGVFITGLEATGVLYAYVLDHVSGDFHRVATFPSGHVAVMDVQFDRDVGYLWSLCDNGCANRVGLLQLDADPLSEMHGKFHLVRMFDPPSTLPNTNNEGIAVAPESECVNNLKAFFWADDAQLGGHALRQDSIPCGSFLDGLRR